MIWGSTKAGELFTGCKQWAVEVRGEQIFFEVDSQIKVVAHLLQLQSLHVFYGLMWATCHFDFREGGEKHQLTVDGIPNEKARRMQKSISGFVVDALAELVSANSVALESWLERAMTKLKSKAGEFISEGDIQEALKGALPPAAPGELLWNNVFERDEVCLAREKGKSWPKWGSSSPELELKSRVEAHNRLTFDFALKKWLFEIESITKNNKWIPKSYVKKFLSEYPAPLWPGREWKQILGDSSPGETLKRIFGRHNSEHLLRQREGRKEFFDKVEKNPLTDEQIHACVCMDDSVMIVAAAGSGKTSTMVAKVGYVLHEQLADPEQILLLAFNRATADEVGERISEQLQSVPNVDRVRSNTFHAFGIEVIAKVTGRKPSLAPWLDPNRPGGDVLEVANIIKYLSESDHDFKMEWDVFRTVYGRDVGRWGQKQEPELYREGKKGFLTARGDVVKSKEERVIAEWLFYNGVDYEYERAYEHDTANECYRQYFPDFYYPEAGIYHEHFALNSKGEAPENFVGYLDSVEWKRKIHLEKGTTLVETTSYCLMTGRWVDRLRNILIENGVSLNFDASRRPPGLPPVSDQDLARSFRVFQQHVKNNGLTARELREALESKSEDDFVVRMRMYLGLYERIAEEWERRLKEGGFIDFEDMLVQAAGHIESGDYKSPYSVILADEFQDSSRARIRLLKALLKSGGDGSHLCVVGDDWQGINRFAGADISVMTEFEKTFEYATRLTLSTTFRCPQVLCDVSSNFIQENPVQIRKSVRTANPLIKTPVMAFGFKDEVSMLAHVEETLADMYRYAMSGKLVPMKGAHISIMLLGRYRDDRPDLLGVWQRKFEEKLKIDFRTVHGSKGLEAEYVIVLNVVEGTRGFPSLIQDDPVLQLAMPAPDPYPLAEERRLFYVAMTRARKQVRLYTLLSHPSQFLVELVKAGHLEIQSVDGEALESCPQCSNGVLQLRQGKYGEFLGCSRFPKCDLKRKVKGKKSKTVGHSARLPLTAKIGDQCPACGKGVIQKRNGRNGVFLGCSQYRTGCRATGNIH